MAVTTIAVLPIPGRAAIIIKSDFCQTVLARLTGGSYVTLGVAWWPSDIYGFGLSYSPKREFDVDENLNNQLPTFFLSFPVCQFIMVSPMNSTPLKYWQTS